MADMLGKYGDEAEAGLEGLAAVSPKYAIKDAATAATHEIVAAVAGKRILVLGFILVAAGTNTVKFLSAATQISGQLPLVAGVPAALEMEEAGLFQTAEGEALNMSLSAAVQTGVTVVYALI